MLNVTGGVIDEPGGVEWDGRYLAVGDQYTNTIYQLQIASSGATIVGSSHLTGAGDPTYQFWFPNFGNKSNPQAKRVVACDFGSPGAVGVWKYPAGGNPIKIFPGDGSPGGLTVSPGRR